MLSNTAKLFECDNNKNKKKTYNFYVINTLVS